MCVVCGGSVCAGVGCDAVVRTVHPMAVAASTAIQLRFETFASVVKDLAQRMKDGVLIEQNK